MIYVRAAGLFAAMVLGFSAPAFAQSAGFVATATPGFGSLAKTSMVGTLAEAALHSMCGCDNTNSTNSTNSTNGTK